MCPRTFIESLNRDVRMRHHDVFISITGSSDYWLAVVHTSLVLLGRESCWTSVEFRALPHEAARTGLGPVRILGLELEQ